MSVDYSIVRDLLFDILNYLFLFGSDWLLCLSPNLVATQHNVVSTFVKVVDLKQRRHVCPYTLFFELDETADEGEKSICQVCFLYI